MLLESERARHAVGEVAVPYGTCTEPTNVKAGGGACPVRFRCVGCDHFRTNIAFLPDLQAYLDDLLRTRERLAAAIDGVDDWARADATPTEEEITRIRRLITRIKGDVADLDDTEQAQHRRRGRDRAPSPRGPHRPARHAYPRRHPTRISDHTRFGGQRMTTNTDTTSNHTPAQSVSSTTRTRSMLDGRRDDSMRRRRRVLAAIDQAAAAGDRLNASAIARAAGVDRTFLYRHRDLTGENPCAASRSSHR